MNSLPNKLYVADHSSPLTPTNTPEVLVPETPVNDKPIQQLSEPMVVPETPVKPKRARMQTMKINSRKRRVIFVDDSDDDDLPIVLDRD